MFYLACLKLWYLNKLVHLPHFKANFSSLQKETQNHEKSLLFFKQKVNSFVKAASLDHPKLIL